MIYMGLKRHEMEEAAEVDLLAVAETMIPDSPGSEDLKAARDYFPSFFGKLFPTLGLAVERTEGESRYADKPQRPGLLRGRIITYYPAMPARGAQTRQDDRTGKAKKITRRVRGEFLEKVFASKLGPYFRVVESRGGTIDEIGLSLADERGESTLFLDRTEFEIHV